MAWDIWDTVFYDNKANMSLYDLVGGRVQVRDDVIYLGTIESVDTEKGRVFFESFLRPRIARYQDFDVTVKLEIESTGKTDGENEDLSHWFGLGVRAIRVNHWDAYLFYIRKDGRVDFGIMGHPVEKPPPVPAVASQAVTFRIKAEGDRVQTWVNDRPYHDWHDEQREFIRKGDVYLISYIALVKIYEVTIKVKKWYAPILRFLRSFWGIVIAIGVIISIVAGIAGLIDLLTRR